jgi:hypothetical protein
MLVADKPDEQDDDQDDNKKGWRWSPLKFVIIEVARLVAGSRISAWKHGKTQIEPNEGTSPHSISDFQLYKPNFHHLCPP